MDKNYKVCDGKILISTQELCDKLSISRKTLSEWDKKGCPKSNRGWWPLWEVLQWRGILNGKDSEGATMEGSDQYSLNIKKLKYEAEYKKQKAEEAAYENAITRGDYVLKEDISNELKRFFVVLKRSMLGYSRRIVNEIGVYVDSITARRIENMLNELTIDALEQISINGVYNNDKKKSK